MAKTAPHFLAKPIRYACYFAMFFLASISVANAQMLTLTEQNDDLNIFDHMVVVGDHSFDFNNLSVRQKMRQKVSKGSVANEITPETTSDGDWLYVQLENSTKNGISRVLDTEHFSDHNYAIYLERAGKITLILDSRLPAKDIENRIRPEVILASLPIYMAPQETVEIWAQFQNGSSAGAVPIYLRSESIVTQHRSKNSATNSIFYGVGLTLLTFLVLFSFLLKSKPAIYYSLFLAASIAVNMQQDGYFSLMFYSGDPNFNIITRLFGQSLMLVSYLLFMISFLDIRRRFPKFFAMICGYMVVVVIILGLYPFVGTTDFYNYCINIVALMFAVISLGSAFLAYRSKRFGAGLFILGIAIFISYLVYSVSNNFLWQTSYDFNVILTVKIAQLVDASVFTAAMLRQTFGLRMQRDEALKSELAATQKNLETAQSLLVAKKDRDRAKALAEQHRAQLANVSHDMRQPLTSLQLALEQVDNSSPELKEQLAAGLNYLNSLLGDTLTSTRPDGHDSHAAEPATDAVPIQIIFDNLERMFGTEAMQKGLALKLEPTNVAVDTDAVLLIRILSNLISNAIKYTQKGQVELLCFQYGDKASIEVRDSGVGLTEEQLSRVMKPYQRNTVDGDGEGLGLHIVSTMAEQAGLVLEADSDTGRGTVFRLDGFRVYS
ncbi:MAG: sensor histidine kinase [Parasphingorhabdus sp.]|uniref:sensor histidine kinase n=3 Tax=Parasphingorhabdus sp. TaxID=2709688 RepID=UPI0032632272